MRHAEQQRHVQFSVVEPPAKVPGEGGIQVKLDVWPSPPNGCHQWFCDEIGDAVEDSARHDPAVADFLGTQFGFGLLQFGDRPASVVDEDSPGFGEHHAAVGVPFASVGTYTSVRFVCITINVLIAGIVSDLSSSPGEQSSSPATSSRWAVWLSPPSAFS